MNTGSAGWRGLYGTEAAGKLRKAHVLIVGIGGVGSWVAEALARSGIGQLTIVDFDTICLYQHQPPNPLH